MKQQWRRQRRRHQKFTYILLYAYGNGSKEERYQMRHYFIALSFVRSILCFSSFFFWPSFENDIEREQAQKRQ